MSSRLRTLPRGFHSDRTELLNLLLSHGILYRSPTQPVLSRDGTSANWMLDSLAVSLTPRGVELAGRCLLELLSTFDGRQLASYGVTGLPLLTSCILQSRGKYRGLVVRKEPKKHGSLRIIDGPANRHDPVILVDDSISSGISMTEACERLESAGFRVEGSVVLVRFGWYGGYARMQERGYHMEAVFDIWKDLMANMEGEVLPLANPSKYFPPFHWSTRAAPEELHPASLARLVLYEYLSSGEVLSPPARLDTPYNASGGAWVSIRSRDNIHVRHGRDGFWNFPGERCWSAAEAVIRAAVRTARNLEGLENKRSIVESSHIAVTFFSALEPCTIAELDNDRYGIVVRSRERLDKMGGALPRMPGISNEWEQFHHARTNNARLVSFEPFAIFRHELTKIVEPGALWQPTGVARPQCPAWYENTELCGRVADRARDVVTAELLGTEENTAPLPDDLLPPEVDSVFLTVYIAGKIRGCSGSVCKNLDAALRKLAVSATQDARFPAIPVQGKDSVAISVSFLFNPLELGPLSAEEVSQRIRSGQHALMAYHGKSFGLLLPSVASTHNLSAPTFCSEVLAKARIRETSARWCRFECACWLKDNEGVACMKGGFKSVSSPAWSVQRIRHSAEAQVRYLLRQQRGDGSFFQSYYPFQHKLCESSSLARSAHAGWVLGRAYNVFGIEDAVAGANTTIDYLLQRLHSDRNDCWIEGDEPASVSELSFLLLALCELDHKDSRRLQASAIGSSLWNRIDLHGRVGTHKDPARALDAYQDYYPGQLLLALTRAASCGLTPMDTEKLHRAFRYYRHRFRYKRGFGQVSWLMQAFARWWLATREQELSQFVFEVGGWILEYQQQKTGAFTNDHQCDTPGYTTAIYLEGLASAWVVASELGDSQLRSLYRDSSRRALEFLDSLIIQERDYSVLPNPEFASGALRCSVYRSEVRIDAVQHLLSALLELYPRFRDESLSEVDDSQTLATAR